MNLSNLRRPSKQTALRTAFVEPLESRRLLANVLSGQYVTDSIAIGQTKTYNFTGAAGQTVVGIVSEQTAVGGNSTPSLRLVDPDGAVLANTWDATGVEITTALTKNGTYSFIVGDQFTDSAVNFGFSLNCGATPVVTNDNLSGPVDSGRYFTNTIQPGELNVYTVDLIAGASLRAAHAEAVPVSGNSTPRLMIFSPSGVLVADSWEATGLTLAADEVTEAGTYRVVVLDKFQDSALATGVTIVNAPARSQSDDGNSNGALADGDSFITSLAPGEINAYAVPMVAGQSVTLSLAETTPTGGSPTPTLVVVAPSGAVLYDSWDATGLTADLADLPETGLYTVMIADKFNDAAIDVRLSRAGGGNPFAVANRVSRVLTVSGSGEADVMTASIRDTVRNSVATQELVLTRGTATNTAFIDDVGRMEAFLGAGNDSFVASADFPVNSYVFGDTGDDVIYTGNGDDTITGGAGRNRMFGQGGEDRINGSSGRDFLRGGGDDDRLYGNAGNDDLAGEGNIDRLFGGDGDDSLKGGGSNDKLYGEAGNDSLAGEGQRDLLLGGSGDDLFGSRDDLIDTLDGGAGADRADRDDIDSVLNIETFL